RAGAVRPSRRRFTARRGPSRSTSAPSSPSSGSPPSLPSIDGSRQPWSTWRKSGNPKSDTRLPAAFDRGRAKPFCLERPAQCRVCRIAEHGLTTRRELLQALREVDGVTDERVLSTLITPDQRGRDQSGREPD